MILNVYEKLKGKDRTAANLSSPLSKIFILVWFDGISTTVRHLMQNPFYTYLLNIGFLNTF